MAVRKILTIPDPRLYEISEKVTEFGRPLRPLIRDMFDTMYAADGVGLAAIQIGVKKRILVLDLTHFGFVKGVFINPEVVEQSKEMQEGDEGCLSVPGLSVPLKRPKYVKVKYQDLNGSERIIEGEMLLARALLHEMDHLDGKVFVDLLEPAIKREVAEDIERIKQGLMPQKERIPEYRKEVSKARA
ncbi:MAG: peptide deformylase [Candidatus Hydrogenedentota bacterium]|nr:MAG: peptide deformylase [Candidatus Hydrogenedentota bacterium]